MDHPNWLLDLTQLPYSMGIICVSHGLCVFVGFSGGSVMKNPAANAGDPCSILGLGRSSGEDPLEEEMTTHSSILAWRIPWTEEPGGL